MENQAILDKYRVMVVDDEPGILNAVRRELSTPSFGARRYEVEIFSDPREALKRGADHSFDVVISDYRMPEMTGLEFLAAFAKLQPECPRIVLSGQTDFDALISMINETHIFRFIPKPWSSLFLRSSINQAVEMKDACTENRRLANLLRERGIALPRPPIALSDQILVVDDEIQVAHAVARALTQRSRFEELLRAVQGEVGHRDTADQVLSNISVQVSDSGQHALKMADEVSFSCVIADDRMPEMDGAEFLAKLKQKQPDCACIMLSGVVNMEGLVVALDFAHLQAFLCKPWSDFELRAAVAQALARRRLLVDNRLLAEFCTSHGLDDTRPG